MRAACGGPGARTRNLGRLPKHAEAQLDGDPQALTEQMAHRLRGWRKDIRRARDTTEMSAEKGYLREFGNLVFHFSAPGCWPRWPSASCSATRATSS
jgi:cytochrome c biogenesis protein